MKLYLFSNYQPNNLYALVLNRIYRFNWDNYTFINRQQMDDDFEL